MRLLITESKLKSFFENKLGIDLTGKIEVITNVSDLYGDLRFCFSNKFLNTRMNYWGPIFLISLNEDTKFMYQKENKDNCWIVDNDCNYLSENELMDKIGIPPLGLSFEDIISLYT